MRCWRGPSIERTVTKAVPTPRTIAEAKRSHTSASRCPGTLPQCFDARAHPLLLPAGERAHVGDQGFGRCPGLRGARQGEIVLAEVAERVCFRVRDLHLGLAGLDPVEGGLIVGGESRQEAEPPSIGMGAVPQPEELQRNFRGRLIEIRLAGSHLVGGRPDQVGGEVGTRGERGELALDRAIDRTQAADPGEDQRQKQHQQEEESSEQPVPEAPEEVHRFCST
jgi:hypothetical protein